MAIINGAGDVCSAGDAVRPPIAGADAGVVDLAVARQRAVLDAVQELSGTTSRDVICSCRIHPRSPERTAIEDEPARQRDRPV
jgi:hypothetical protein